MLDLIAMTFLRISYKSSTNKSKPSSISSEGFFYSRNSLPSVAAEDIFPGSGSKAVPEIDRRALGLGVASRAIISGFAGINSSTLFNVGVMYTLLSWVIALNNSNYRQRTVFLISMMSSGVFARIPAAPPSKAAAAIRPIIYEECKGSLASA